MADVRHCLCIFFIYWIGFAYGQKPSPNKRAQAAYIEAGKLLRINKLDEAAQKLSTAISYDPNFATAHQQLGDILRKQDRFIEASIHYQKVLQVDPDLTALTYFALGESLLFSGKYAEAQQALQRYLQRTAPTASSLKLIEKYLADCRYALLHNESQRGILQRLEGTINTPDDEYFPKLTADNRTIIFTRKTNNQENFYASNLTETGWSEAEKLAGNINSEAFNEGAHCISPDGKYLFFTGCNWPNGMGSCDIYVSKLESGSWSQPHNLGAPINSKGWEAQPAISADGRTLYFVSNREGGLGGYDIYSCRLQDDGSWSIPKNLGPKINSAFDESSPYIHADGRTLYFVSDGWPGFGRKDLFFSQLDSIQQWSTPINMGNGVNDFRDQTSIHVSMNGEVGHVSAQSSSGNLDIYSFRMPTGLQPDPVAYIAGSVRDANSDRPLDATIEVINTTTGNHVFRDHSDPGDGTFLAVLPIGANYAFQIQRAGYLSTSRQFALDNPQFTNDKFEIEIRLSAIEKGSVGTLNNIYFAVNRYELLSESTADLQLLFHFLRRNATVQIEIAGHTDSSGDSQSNQLLSERRAAAVKTYLLEKGISPDRITTKGYGANMPIASNNTEAGKRLNRRTTFSITGL
ncbi:OmpA family protein [Sphingobacterium griseoflavum]|uniref:OmpA-like domain-containing protein n=1 Tax=Sphingobacterium griseoflavum TaxID=1474952 RepID=A0ABQ3HT39_9SPHI|nr:OmpA family protein [Sphingobacterium griseoflavum]GHE23175.1 hypothetical protein GCM10017764_01430 [Sphingobacterium griseoflavum]